MDDKTIQAYNRMAEGYDQGTSDYWSRTPQPPFIGVFSAALAGKRVLDVGCGPGRDGLIFRRHGLEPICLDASFAMLELAAQKGLATVLGDFAHLPFGNAEFDGVWAYTSLLHVRKDEVLGVLSEIRRVHKTGGIFGLGLLEGDGEEYRDIKEDGNPRWFNYYQLVDVQVLLARSGYSLMQSSRITPGPMPHLHFLARAV